MRFPRITTRRLMATVALVALALWAGLVFRRWLEVRQLARYHGIMAQVLAVQVEALRTQARIDRSQGRANSSDADSNADHLERWLAYQAALARKYERAARYPWLSVAPGPPPPK